MVIAYIITRGLFIPIELREADDVIIKSKYHNPLVKSCFRIIENQIEVGIINRM
jgi:hypothetical protein